MLAFSAIWLLGLPGDWLLDDFSLLDAGFPSLLRPRPLTYLTFWLNHEWFGPTPWAYRLTNILLHAVAVQFCYRALRRIIGEPRALFAAAIFAVHPLQADAVLYIFSRPVVLMGLLLWAALDRWLAGKHWAAVVLYGFALAAKEEAIAFAPFLILLHFSISRNVKEFRPIAVMLAMGAVAAGGLVIAARQEGSGAGGQAGLPWLDYFATQPRVLVEYFRLAVWPKFHGMRWSVDLMPHWVALAWLAIAVQAYRMRQLFPRAGALLWLSGALVFLLPTSSLFPLADVAASRRMYIPVALLFAAFPARRELLILVCLYAAISADWAITLYRDPKAIWKATMERQVGELGPVLQYAKFLPPAEALKLLEAHADFESAAYHTEIGRVRLELGQPAEALQAFGRALAREPGVASHVYNRGVALAALGQKEAAEMDFRRALEIDPNHKPAKAALAIR